MLEGQHRVYGVEMAGFTWSTKKREQINKEIEKLACQDNEEKAVSGKIRKALEKR